MPKIPVLNHKKIVRILESIGFVFERQKGSHKIFKKGGVGITIPCHNNKNLKTGTLKNIIKQADISVEDLIKFADQ